MLSFEKDTANTTTDAVSQGTGSVLATFYAGIGDAIIHGPILCGLVKRLGNRLVLPESLGFEILRHIPELRVIRTVPATYRNLHLLSPSTSAVEALTQAGVKTILNFRRDRIVDAARYELFTTAVASHNIRHFDACDGVSLTEQLADHTAGLACRFVRSLGLDYIAPAAGWLRPFIASDSVDRNNRIGFFLGASVAVKRPSVQFWSATISQVSRKVTAPLLLIGGASVEEHHFADTLSTDLRRLGIPHSIAPRLNLPDLAAMIAKLRAVVTPDTFVLPLAEALDTPVVGIMCATDARVYGTQHHPNRTVSSPYYALCPSKNLVGNCDGWERGCSHLTCHSHLEPHRVVAALQKALFSEDGSS